MAAELLADRADVHVDVAVADVGVLADRPAEEQVARPRWPLLLGLVMALIFLGAGAAQAVMKKAATRTAVRAAALSGRMATPA